MSTMREPFLALRLGGRLSVALRWQSPTLEQVLRLNGHRRCFHRWLPLPNHSRATPRPDDKLASDAQLQCPLREENTPPCVFFALASAASSPSGALWEWLAVPPPPLSPTVAVPFSVSAVACNSAARPQNLV